MWVGYPDSNVHMYSEYHGGPVAGGTFPAEIWGDYTKAVKGSFCGEFAPPKDPMTFTRFYGKYAGGGSSSSSGTYDPNDPSATAAPTTGTGGTTTTPPTTDDGSTDGGSTNTDSGAGGFDPDLYESTPQPPPDG